MRKKIQDLVPLGISITFELKNMAIALVQAILFSSRFLFGYWSDRGDLYYITIDGNLVLREGAVMTSFEQLIRGCFSGFWVCGPLLIILTIWHYMYHYQGSKSIWLMRRLPKRTELHRRCLALPLLGAIACVLVALILYVIYYQIYMLCTPAECLRL